MKSFQILFLYAIFLSGLMDLCFCLRAKTKLHLLNQENDKKGNTNLPPVIHLHIEEPTSEPDDTRRLAEESRSERNRIRELEQKEELDKQGFQQVINMQNDQIEKLSFLTELTAQMAAQKIIADDS